MLCLRYDISCLSHTSMIYWTISIFNLLWTWIFIYCRILIILVLVFISLHIYVCDQVSNCYTTAKRVCVCGCMCAVCTGLPQLNHCPRMKWLVFIQSFPATLYTTTTLLGETNVSFWIQNNKEPSFVHFHSVYPVYKEKGLISLFYLSASLITSSLSICRC